MRIRWHTSTVETAGQSTWPSLAFSPSGQPAIAYYSSLNSALRFATLNADGSWAISTVDTVGSDCQPSLAFRSGRPAISYLHTSYPREEMAALYRAADIMVVTPYRDGMNLVAKEYVACRVEEDGALVLSEFAGAAEELKQAWLVNPYDINGMKTALLEAYNAQPRELTRRMRAMRKQISQHDVKAWAASFMTELEDVGGHTKHTRPASRS